MGSYIVSILSTSYYQKVIHKTVTIMKFNVFLRRCYNEDVIIRTPRQLKLRGLSTCRRPLFKSCNSAVVALAATHTILGSYSKNRTNY